MTKSLVVCDRKDVINKDAIIPGCLVVLRQGTKCIVTLMHSKGRMQKFLMSKNGVYYGLNHYNDKLLHNTTYNPLDVMQVWGLQKYDDEFFDKNFEKTFSESKRKLLWEEKGYSMKNFVEKCEQGAFDSVPFTE
jgi:hypothetical protein